MVFVTTFKACHTKICGASVAILRLFYMKVTPRFVEKVNVNILSGGLLTTNIMMDLACAFMWTFAKGGNRPLYNICMNSYSPNDPFIEKPMVPFLAFLFVPLLVELVCYLLIIIDVKIKEKSLSRIFFNRKRQRERRQKHIYGLLSQICVWFYQVFCSVCIVLLSFTNVLKPELHMVISYFKVTDVTMVVVCIVLSHPKMRSELVKK